MTDQENSAFVPFDDLEPQKKLELMDRLALYMSVKPELAKDAKTDEELIERIIAFAKVLHECSPKEKKKESVYNERGVLFI